MPAVKRSPEVRKSFHIGSPAEMTKLNRAYVEAGVDFVAILHVTPLILGPAEGEQSLRRFNQVFAELKRA